jgi:RNA polymerase sigma-70 factor (ECF subfamily)
VESKGSFQQFVQQLRSGDSAAATELYDRFVGQLINLAAHRIDSRFRAKFDPDDVVQSVFHSFFQRHAEDQFRFADWNNLWSLLATITIRKCGRRAKAFSRDRRAVDREVGGIDEATFDFIRGRQPTAEDAMMLEETLQQLFDELTPEQRDILRLKLEKYSPEEISEKVGRTERTVYRVLSHVRERLEKMAVDCG